MNFKMAKYIIITPAKNEEKYIELTIQSVIKQTVLPMKWIIVDDGSTDNTASIVRNYSEKYSFIRLVQLPFRKERHFAGKVYAIQEGFKHVEDVDYKFYCNLDGDVSFDPNYFEYLLNEFAKNPKLGICGGKVYDKIKDKFIAQKSGLDSVAGPVQFFRRECYENIGGYIPSELGLVDAVAEVTARMKGWETKTFPALIIKHHRKVSSAKNNSLQIAFREGLTDYHLGFHPLWHLLRSYSRLWSDPIFIGSIIRTVSFFNCYLTRKKRLVNTMFVEYIRHEERQKFLGYFKHKFLFSK